MTSGKIDYDGNLQTRPKLGKDCDPRNKNPGMRIRNRYLRFDPMKTRKPKLQEDFGTVQSTLLKYTEPAKIGRFNMETKKYQFLR